MIEVRVEPITQDINLIIREDLGPQARSRMFAEAARQIIDETNEDNRRILGSVPPHKIYVDGKLDGAHLETVKDSIVVEYELVDEALQWIGEQLRKHSPVYTGRYRFEHTLFADGIEVHLGEEIPPAMEYIFINSTPYARKIERGLSSQAPKGVYQVVAVLARRKFRGVATIRYSFRTAVGGMFSAKRKAGERNPAIIVKVK